MNKMHKMWLFFTIKGELLVSCSSPFMMGGWGLIWFSGKLVGIDYAMLPNCEWNQKQKHKKQPWGN
ncbi:MAG: hypothetical protein UDD86_09015, partial [Sodaliphilus sp.]|nr:hypothetical protein [Sodaliphilus sp.]